MKFVVDAQLPRRLARELAAAGHDVMHTLDLKALFESGCTLTSTKYS
jgi:predicted nuclease of predicted toxin-antitoxin system